MANFYSVAEHRVALLDQKFVDTDQSVIIIQIFAQFVFLNLVNDILLGFLIDFVSVVTTSD